MSLMYSTVKILWFFILITCVCQDGNAFQRPEYVLKFTFGEKGAEPGQMNAPEGITVDVEKNIYVADTGNNRIQKFSPSGEFINFFGGFGWGSDQFDEPVAIFGEMGLDIYVVDKNNHRIMRFDPKLNFISSLQLNDTADEMYRFQFPVAIAVSELRDKYVIDSENGRVIRYNAFDNAEEHFGGYSSTGIPLDEPVDVAIFQNQKIYIADAGQKCIVVYDYFGNYIEYIGKNIVQNPSGLCTDEEGRLYVCDKDSREVKIFKRNGEFSRNIREPGFKILRDIACRGDELFIIDQETSRIYVFNIRH